MKGINFPDRGEVRIGDVARVVEGFAAPIGNAIIDDGPGLMLIVEKQPTGNTLQLTRDVEAAIGEVKPGLRDVKVDTTIFRPATFIDEEFDNLWGCHCADQPLPLSLWIIKSLSLWGVKEPLVVGSAIKASR